VKSGDSTSSDLIDIQKGRAIARWDEAFHKQYFDENTYHIVLEKLKIGEVPPIYHALCRDPAKRLFLPNTFVSSGRAESGRIKLSSEKVQAGSGKILFTSLRSLASASQRSYHAFGQSFLDLLGYPDSVWNMVDFSYLEVFFSKDGHHVSRVKDSFFEKYWDFDEEIAKLVTDLVNTSAKMVGQDLEVTELPSEFPVDLFNGRRLITRSLSRGVVADCFEQSKPGSIHAIVGSPGIGKSWSLIYALQQGLLYENSCVVFCFQKKGIAWVCIRKMNCIYAWSNESYGFEILRSGLFKNGNVLALLDPKEALAGGASYHLDRQRLVFAASNNEAHFKNVYKDTPRYERILNPYSTLEVEIALKYMSPSDALYSDDEVLPMLQLAEKFGNMPRYILNEHSAGIMSTKVKEHIQEIGKMDSAKLLDFLSFKGITGVEEKKTIKGAIFSLFADGSINKDYSLTDVGYDGDAEVDGEAVVDYHKRLVKFVSMNVAAHIAQAHRGTLLSYDGKSMDGLGSHFGHIVEDLFWMDMEKNIKMQVYDLGNKGKSGNIDFYFQNAVVHGKRTRLKDLSAVFMATDGGKSKCRIIVNGALIDFAMGREVFQVTVQKTHSVNRDGVKELLIAGGILKEENNVLSYSKGVQMVIDKTQNTLKRKPPLVLTKKQKALNKKPRMVLDRNHKMLQKWKLKFYWVVPDGVSQIWMKKKPLDVDSIPKEPKSGSTRKRKRERTELLDEAWKKFVDQYVAVMSPNLESAGKNIKKLTM
jgi:hypothetical protein